MWCIPDAQLQQILRISSDIASDKRKEGDAHMQMLKENITALGLALRTDVPGDGNCFFHCIENQLEWLGLTSKGAAQLRAEVVAFLRETNDLMDHKTDADAYLSHMGTNGVFVDHTIVLAMTRILGRDISSSHSRRKYEKRTIIIS